MFDLSKFVDILATHNYDAEALCVELAKTDPDLFVELVESTNIKRLDLPLWVKKYVNEIRYCGYINSIKTLREYTSLGLKDAKDTVDNLVNYRLHVLCEKSHYDVTSRDNNHLNEECTKIYDLVCEGFKRY